MDDFGSAAWELRREKRRAENEAYLKMTPSEKVENNLKGIREELIKEGKDTAFVDLNIHTVEEITQKIDTFGLDTRCEASRWTCIDCALGEIRANLKKVEQNKP